MASMACAACSPRSVEPSDVDGEADVHADTVEDADVVGPDRDTFDAAPELEMDAPVADLVGDTEPSDALEDPRPDATQDDSDMSDGGSGEPDSEPPDDTTRDPDPDRVFRDSNPDPDGHRGDVLELRGPAACECADERAQCLEVRPGIAYECLIYLAEVHCIFDRPCPERFECLSWVGFGGFPDLEFSSCRCVSQWRDSSCAPQCADGTDADCPADFECFLPDRICTADVWNWECGSDVACEYWWEECVAGTCQEVFAGRLSVRDRAPEEEPISCHSHLDCDPSEERCVMLPHELDWLSDFVDGYPRWWAECREWPVPHPHWDCPDHTFSPAGPTVCIDAARPCTVDAHCDRDAGEFCHANHDSCAFRPEE